MDRPGSCSPTAAPLARHSTETACDPCGCRSPTTASWRARPKPARFLLSVTARYAGSNLAQGQIVAIDPERGVQLDAVVKKELAGRAPYGRWLDEGLVEGSAGEPVDPPERDLTREQVLYGYTREELTMFLRPIAGHGHDPTYSMGDDTALPPLAGRSRPLYHYFKQRFAQVTNPPIDHLRERFAMSTRVVLGSRAPLFSDGADVAGGIELDSFFLFPSALEELSPGWS